MKKFITVMLAVIMVMAMSVTAFAADSPTAQAKTYNSISAETTTEIYNKSGAKLIIDVDDIADKTATNAKAAQIASGDTVMGEFDISGRYTDGTAFSGAATVKINVPGIKKGDSVYVLHQKADGTWETLSPSEVGDNYVVVTFTSIMSPVIVVKAASAKAAATTTVKTATSPKTGESPVLPIMIALCGAGAVLCATKSRARA